MFTIFKGLGFVLFCFTRPHKLYMVLLEGGGKSIIKNDKLKYK